MKKFLLNSKDGMIRLIVSVLLGIALGYFFKIFIAPFIASTPLLVISVFLYIMITASPLNDLIDVVWKKYIHE